MAGPHGGIGPGKTIGILGGGQLARMMAIEARKMGYRVAVVDPDPKGSAAQLADVFVKGAFNDLAAARELAQHADVITLDSEHIPADLLEQVEKTTVIRPSSSVMRTIQDRLEQRRFLGAHSVPQTRFAPVGNVEELRAAIQSLGVPCILKTRREGYDGKGQFRIHDAGQADEAWRALGHVPCLLEAFVEFEREISVILARGLDGEIRYYPLAENDHRRHVLHTSLAPAPVPGALEAQARDIGERIATELGHVGVMAVELFLTDHGQLLVNEIAPRTHNSGHYTFGACVTSQFEQHVRAVCGLPLGAPDLLRPAVMLNLLGDLWKNGEPRWEAVFSHPNASLHLYGKGRASPGRKMGHVLVLDEDAARALAVAEEIFQRLSSGV